MTSSTPRLSPRFSFTATRCAVAMLLTASAVAVQPAWAARLGHSRVVSAQNAPLQVLIPLTDLTPDERASLQVSVASADAWQRAGLKPPVSLSSLTLKVENGADASQRNVRLTSSEVAADPAVDVLLNIGSGAGQRLVQLTVMQTERGFPGLNAQATVGTPSRAGGAGGGNVAVRQGDTLYGIAQSHALADATIYQMLVALWRANPQAFIGNNMNRVKAGARLIVPDASTVRAIDPGEARRIFLEQAEAYARYRAGLAGAAGRGAAATQAPTASGQIGAGAPAAQSDSGAQDRLRLSSGVPGQAGQSAEAAAQSRGDAEVSQAKADQDAKTRVDELERNVKDLNAALASQGQGGQGASGASGSGLTVPGVTVPGGPGAVAQAGANAPTGASSQGQGSTGAGGPGATGAGGQPGTAGQGAGAGQGGGQAGVNGQPANGQPANGQSAPNAQSSGAGQAGAANDAAGQPGAAGQAGGAGQSGSGAAGNAATGDGAGSNAGNNAGAAAGSNAGSGAGNGTGGSAGNGAGTPADSAGGTAAGAAGNAGNASNTSNAGTPGAAGAGASSSPSGTGASTPGATAPGTSAAPSTPNSATSNGTANNDNASGANSNANSGSNSATAGGKAAQSTSSLPRWLSDNLLIFMTVVLTLIAFVIAWLLRRAGARRNDEDDDMDEDLYATEIDPAAIDRRLDGINLDLDSQPGDTPARREPGVGPRGTLPGSSRP